MPNWVINRLTVEGENADTILDSICTIDDDGEKRIDFNKIMPMPEDLNIVAGSLTDRCVELYLTYINPDVGHYGAGNKVSQEEFLNILEKLGEDEWDFVKEMCGDSYPGICKYRRDVSEEEIQSGLESMASDKDLDGLTPLEYGKKAVNNVLTYGAMTWYDWRSRESNWGVKWNASSCDIQGNIAQFNTPWGDVRWLMGIFARNNPESIITYEYAEEQGGVYAGSIVFEGDAESGGNFDEDSKEAWDMYFEFFGGKENYRFDEKNGTYEYIDDSDDSDTINVTTVEAEM